MLHCMPWERAEWHPSGTPSHSVIHHEHITYNTYADAVFKEYGSHSSVGGLMLCKKTSTVGISINGRCLLALQSIGRMAHNLFSIKYTLFQASHTGIWVYLCIYAFMQ